MSKPVYRCSVCGSLQPVSDVSEEDPPAVLGNTSCRGKYGGCLRMTRLHHEPEVTWEPAEWNLACPHCDYETVAWGEVGFADTSRWDCPDCGNAMRVVDVTQVDQP